MSNAKHGTNFIYLASRSPRRCELLQQLGMSFEQVPADIDESIQAGEKPEDYVLRMALEKARVAASKLDSRNVPVLGADTAVVVDGQILGKPDSKEDAFAMLRKLSNNTHEVLSAIALVGGDDELFDLNCTKVSFRRISDAEMTAYWALGESSDKAGAYAIQGYAALFIEQISGSYSGVMGLPLFETGRLLESFGYRLLGKAVH